MNDPSRDASSCEILTDHPCQDPGFSEVARKGKLPGIVVLDLTVGIDGLPTDVCLADAAGSGLDEKAVQAVKLRKFEAGTRDGQPVPVRISVETTFRLY